MIILETVLLKYRSAKFDWTKTRWVCISSPTKVGRNKNLLTLRHSKFCFERMVSFSPSTNFCFSNIRNVFLQRRNLNVCPVWVRQNWKKANEFFFGFIGTFGNIGNGQYVWFATVADFVHNFLSFLLGLPDEGFVKLSEKKILFFALIMVCVAH